jgi:hypothetical protein
MTVEQTAEVRYGLSQFPAFTGRTLIKALQEQGFAVEMNGNQGVITREGMESPYFFHESVISRFNKRSGANLLNDLVNLGFIPPDVWAREHRSNGKPNGRARGEYFCSVETCERHTKPFPYAQNLGRHVSSKHPELVSHEPKITRPAQPRMRADGSPSASPLRVRHTEPTDPRLRVRAPAAKIAAALEVLSEATGKLLEAYDAQYVELQETKDRLRKVEQRLGKVVEAL